MLGKNVIRLNKAEMKTALQHYFKTVVFSEKGLEDTHVTDVSEKGEGAYDGGWFEVTLESPKDTPKVEKS